MRYLAVMVGTGQIVYFRTWISEFGVYPKSNRQPLKGFEEGCRCHHQVFTLARSLQLLCREQIGRGEALRREASLETTAMVQAEGARAVTKAEVGWKDLRDTVEVKTHRTWLIRCR